MSKRKRRAWSSPSRQEWQTIKRAFGSGKLPAMYSGGPYQERVLKVSTEYFSAQARYRKVSGVWSCVAADEQIKWLKGMSCAEAKVNLLKMGAQTSWKVGT